MKGFLYGQTEFNILENAVHLDEYVSLAKQKGYDFLSITDGNLAGHLKFYRLCKKNSIKPVIGLEIKINRDIEVDTILLYPYSYKGYQNLLHLASIKAIGEITIKDIIKYQDGNFIVLVANDSIVIRSIVANCPVEAKYALEEYKNQFENFYLGITFQKNKFKEENLAAATLARELDIKSIYVHQQLYLTKDDEKVYIALKKIQGKEEINVDGDYAFLEDNEIDDEALDLYLENTQELVGKINYNLLEQKVRMPRFPLPEGTNAVSYLNNLARKGLERRLLSHINPNRKVYYERLENELNVINKMQFSDYFLIVWDFIRYAKKNDILVGPGRGSAAGSLVAYSLGITEVDPLEYGLIFERFLNPERVTMPDIDTDFPDNKRDLVISYVKKFYGDTHVSSISTFGTFSAKSSLRDLGRVLKIEGKRLEEIGKLIAKTTDYDTLLANFTYRPDLYDFIYIMKRLEGLPRNTSTHAAGIIISDIDLLDIIPLQLGPNDIYQSQIDAEDLTDIGLLKMDFLGIRNLTIIDNILKEIGKDSRWLRNINLNDCKVLNLLKKADTLGIFQLESDGIRKVLMKLSPTSFDDLVATLALYRPGPMEIIDEYILRKHGKPFTYLHRDLEPILKDTYGFIVYQEQIMQIARKFASYSYGQADLLRRAVSKKNLEGLESERERFVYYSKRNGYAEDVATKIYDYIVKFANYGFNKSHSVAYALVAYQMAYLKTYYPGNFIANILNNVIGSPTVTLNYLNYARNYNLIISSPNINISTDKFVVIGNKIYLPLTAINGIGNQLSYQILNERKNGKFNNFEEFKKRCPFINVKAMESLVFSSALDVFGKTKKALIESKTLTISLIDKYLKDVIEETNEYDEKYLAEQEFKCLGFYLKYDPTKKISSMRKLRRTTPIAALNKGGSFRVIARIRNLKTIKTKSQKQILKGVLYDDTASINFVMFQTLFEEVGKILSENNTYIFGLTPTQEEGFELEAIINFVEIIEKID